MNAFNFAVKSQDANARIVAAAKHIAPRYDAMAQVAALEAVKDKDPQAEQIKRLEAVAALLERIVANLPVIQTEPEPSKPSAPAESPSISADKSVLARKGRR